MLDDKTKALIIRYLRKAWLYSPARRQVIRIAEAGEKTPEGEKYYKCNYSGEPGWFEHPVTKVYVDHLKPMIPLEGFTSWDSLIDRLFDLKNMQCLCKLHHAIKTKDENKQRKRRAK